MKLLLDANIFIEVIFNQRQAAEARALLKSHKHEFYISLFSLYSIGIYVLRRGRAHLWPRFLQAMIHSGRVEILVLSVTELAEVARIATEYALDFDDAYQYVTATVHDLTLVSFDHDFDKTPRGRQTPQAINQLTAAQQQNPSDQQ